METREHSWCWTYRMLWRVCAIRGVDRAIVHCVGIRASLTVARRAWHA